MTIVACSYFKKTHSYNHHGMFALQKNTFYDHRGMFVLHKNTFV